MWSRPQTKGPAWHCWHAGRPTCPWSRSTLVPLLEGMFKRHDWSDYKCTGAQSLNPQWPRRKKKCWWAECAVASQYKTCFWMIVSIVLGCRIQIRPYKNLWTWIWYIIFCFLLCQLFENVFVKYIVWQQFISFQCNLFAWSTRNEKMAIS